jgi:Domain of unknown function (DUF6468)
VNNSLGLMIESLVAALLLLTICYCVTLNKRLKRLKNDELALKATISELITATEIAERAIGGLKLTVRECDQGLGERLRKADAFSRDIAEQLGAGQKILERLTRIASASRSGAAETPAPAPAPSMPPASTLATSPDAQAIMQAAQAFAARTRNRGFGIAA